MHTDQSTDGEMPSGQMDVPSADEGPQAVGEMPGGHLKASEAEEEMPAGRPEAAQAGEGALDSGEMPSGEIEATQHGEAPEAEGMPDEEMD